MDWFIPRGKIGRKDFAIRVLAIMVISGGIFLLVSDLILRSFGSLGYLTFKSFVGLLIIALSLPTIIKRLRDINWPIQVATVFVFAGIFDIRNLVLVNTVIGKDNFIPVTIVAPSAILSISMLCVFVVLLAKKGRDFANPE